MQAVPLAPATGNPIQGFDDLLLAQIMPDATLGAEASVVMPNAVIQGTPADLIEGGAIRETNLFHSFEAFNVNTGQRVYFGNPIGIENILTRVTGNDISDIMGTLGVDGVANLFLLNPNGIIFGPDAQLDIRGSFVATTANGFTFLDGSEFSAVDPQAPPLLTVSVTPGVQFGAVAGDIDNQGRLYVGQDLTLSAENLDLQGQVAAGGDLSLLATDTVQIRDAVEVPFVAFAGRDLLLQGNEQVDIVALSHPNSGLYAYGDMVLRSANPVGGDAHYWSAGDFRVETLEGNMGSLFSPIDPIIRTSGDVEIGLYAGSSLHILAGGSVTIGTATITAPELGALGIDALQEDIALSDGTVVQVDGITQPTLDIRAGVSPIVLGTPPPEVLTGFDPTTDFFVNTSANTIPSAADIEVGDVWVSAPNGLVLLTNQYERNPEISDGSIFVTGEGIYGDGIDARGYGSQGGTVFLDSSENVEINSSIRTNTSDSGAGGDITVLADEVVRFNGAQLKVSTDGVGNAGNIIINGDSLEIDDSILNAGTSVQENGRADAGNIRINAEDTVELNNTFVSVTTVSGDAGEISIRAGRDIFLTTNDPENSFDNSRTSIASQAFQSGSPGSIHITAGEDIELTSDVSYICLFGCLVVTSGFSGAGGSDEVVGEIIFDAGHNISLTDTYDPNIANTPDLRNLRLSTSTSGMGNAGNIMIRANGDVVLDGSSVFSDVRNENASNAAARGNGGNILVEAQSVSMRNRASLQTLVDGVEGDFDAGLGNAGNIVVRGTDYLAMSGASEINSSIGQGATGNGGNIDIGSRVINISGGSSLQVQSAGNGNAGNVVIRAGDLVLIDNGGILSDVDRGAVGDGGDIEIFTGSLSLLNSAQLQTDTEGEGNAGDVTIDARNSVSLSDFGTAIFSNIRAGGVGDGGKITINTDSLTLSQGAQLQSSILGTSEELPGGRGIAGGVNINALGDITLRGARSIIFTDIDAGAEGTGGDIQITAGSLSVLDGAQLRTDTDGRGDAGSVVINAREDVFFDGFPDGESSGAFTNVSSGATGNGGNIRVNARTLRVSDGAVLDARISSTTTSGEDVKGGDIIANVDSLEVFNGGQLLTITEGSERAGDIRIHGADQILISGTDPNFQERVSQFPERISNLGPESGLFVSSEGTGQAGDITVFSGGIIRLDEQGRMIAESSSGNGGDIYLQVRDVLLRRGSLISTTAGTEEEGGGDGGNINIDARGGFVIAVPNENSDIIANAFAGNGGNITITTNRLLGFTEQSDLTTDELRSNMSSDLSASSERGISGDIITTNLAPDPNQGLVELPILSPSPQIQRGCSAAAVGTSSFTVTGRGGLPPSPTDILSRDRILTDLGPDTEASDFPTDTAINEPTSALPDPIIEAQGAIKDADGQVTFLAQPYPVPHHPSPQHVQCNGTVLHAP
ncbi:MAG: filamentous hemagglutinin N-terminal domain-containing protein [Leptolyngbya sp. SIOISBB]|nr:filamentous hemagglutinin N-terminal domain-containing protein [Leptolyngbya sp. SIOISBB]